MKARVVLLNLFCDGPRFSSLASGVLRGWALADRDLAAAVSLEYCGAFIEEPPDAVAARIAARQPDLAGFSCYVWNINATLA
ncbi:MAG: hypothetical protein KGL04_07905, partial [Elusimicrobia bacterium]|nr:hypothetical protein [Elusimicrobiota bacterium]